MTIQLTRLGLYFLLLTFTVVYQVKYPLFINADFLLPLYTFIVLALSVTCIFIFLGEKAKRLQNLSLKVLLPLDAICITGIIYQSGLQNSLYLFFYLYLIFITALNFRLKGALYFAVLCSVLLSVILLLDTNSDSNSKTFLFLVNNLAFFVVAYLSGNLSEQIQTLGVVVASKEKNIQELKNVNSVIVDNMRTGLVYLDSDLNVLQVNNASQEILKIHEKKELTYFLKEMGNFQKHVDSQGKLTKEVSLEIKGEKSILDVLISSLKVQDEDYGYLILFQDVTERKKLEERMKNQEKLAAVGQLAAGIAHEIRNPLASMSGSIQLLSTSFESLDDTQKKLIAITLKETDRLNNLISEFLEFVRPNIPTEDTVSLKRLIEDCIELLKLNKDLPKYEMSLSLEDVSSFKGNRDKLKQVFLNVLINAAQAQPSKVEIKLEEKNGWATIQIKDNGNGMQEEVRKKIFEPFYTTKPKGTGLGLAIVHKIIESHKGTILAESELGIGTVFTIQLPVT